jgi:hypothetical protein
MRLTEKSGRSTMNVEPIGKSYDLDLTKLFSKNMFYDWKPRVYRKKKIIVDFPNGVFIAKIIDETKIEIVYQNIVKIPQSLRPFSKWGLFAGFERIPQTQVVISVNDIKPLIPDIKALLYNINEDIRRKTK